MKIIDLLNKIAKGEEVPSIKWYDRTLIWNSKHQWFDDIDDKSYCKGYFNFEDFNDEVEMIEEEKEIDKFDTNKFHDIDEMVYKINELIDVINDMRDKDE